MKISTQRAISLSNALRSLSGQPRVIKDGEKQRTVDEPYAFSANLRAAIAKNLAKLDAIIDTYNREQQGVVLLVSGGRTEVRPPADDKAPDYAELKAKYDSQIDEYNQIHRLLMNEQHEVALIPIREEELKLDKNAIPFDVLAQLAPIMEGWEAAEEISFKGFEDYKKARPASAQTDAPPAANDTAPAAV